MKMNLIHQKEEKIQEEKEKETDLKRLIKKQQQHIK